MARPKAQDHAAKRAIILNKAAAVFADQGFDRASLANVAAAGVTIIRPDKALFRTRVAAMKEAYEGTDIGQLIARIDAAVPGHD